MRYDRRGLLAAALAFLYPGLGHVYLRTWLRAIAWFGLALVTAALVIPEAAFEAFRSGGISGLVAASRSFGLEVTLSLLVVRALNVVDAYFTALRQGTERVEGESDRCPSCGKELDDSIDFCPWCTTRLDGADGEDEEPVTSR